MRTHVHMCLVWGHVYMCVSCIYVYGMEIRVYGMETRDAGPLNVSQHIHLQTYHVFVGCSQNKWVQRSK